MLQFQIGGPENCKCIFYDLPEKGVNLTNLSNTTGIMNVMGFENDTTTVGHIEM